MILTKLSLWNFRKFSAKQEAPGVEINFHKGVNALIGENNSGKTAIIDAIKIILQTQSNEYFRITEDDFHINEDGSIATEFKIECIFEEFTDDEAKNFIEWLQFKKDSDGKVIYFLNVQFNAWKEKNRIFTEFRAGMNEDGYKMDGKARELLKCTYLKPLRDAEHEMRSGRNSRISQILYNHSVFNSKEEHELVGIIKEANEKIENYFTNTDDGKKVLGKIESNFNEFLSLSTQEDTRLRTSNMRLKSILESLSLDTSETQPGLGVQNLLFIAAELLLLNRDENNGLKLALIEEIEAHLHPQAQLRLIDYIQKEYNDSGVQFIISTHSTALASKINVKNALLCKDDKIFSLAPDSTKLDKGDYLFLQRFLDTSKANLFFAQGVIMVEGDAENLLIPAIADIIDLPLSKYGVSIVNVGSTAFLRYSNIFNQSNGSEIGIPVSIITDCDVKIEYDKDGKLNKKEDDTRNEIERLEKYYTSSCVKAFVAPNWTLEYTIALSVIRKKLYKAVLFAQKIQNSDKYALTEKKIKEVDNEVKSKFDTWKELETDKYEAAYEIYQKTLLDNNISKAITAQCLASILQYSILKDSEDVTEETMFDLDLYQIEVDDEKKSKLKAKILSSKKLAYIVKAIQYATRCEDGN